MKKKSRLKTTKSFLLFDTQKLDTINSKDRAKFFWLLSK